MFFTRSLFIFIKTNLFFIDKIFNLNFNVGEGVVPWTAFDVLSCYLRFVDIKLLKFSFYESFDISTL